MRKSRGPTRLCPTLLPKKSNPESQLALVRSRFRRPTIGVLFSLLFVLPFVARAEIQAKPLVLISAPSSTRAIALEAAAFTAEPFPLTSPITLSIDRRTRVMLFALNLQPTPAGNLSGITANAEDQNHHLYDLKVEYVGAVSGQEWMSAVVVRLSDDMGDVGDVLVRVVNQGQESNRVRIAVGHIGGGPPDDPGSAPTPAPPYLIRGRVLAEGIALADATLTLSGDGIAITSTDHDGNYSFMALSSGRFVVSASKAFYDFSPFSFILNDLSHARDEIDFTASRQSRVVQGQTRDDRGQPLPGVPVALTRSDDAMALETTSDQNGSFNFPAVPAGFDYTVSPVGNSVFAFAPQIISPLVGATSLTFGAVRRSYAVNGRVTNNHGAGLAGATVTLVNAGLTITTDASGNYALPNVPAGFDYTIVASREDYVLEPPVASLPQIDGDRQMNFVATLHVALGGRVTDAQGKGAYSIRVTLSGPQTGTTLTSSDGSYSFLVTEVGNYNLKPSKEQDYYAYAPDSVNLVTLQGSRSANFTATLNASLSPSYVLEFDGTPKTVDYSMPLPGDYNLFWADGVVFGHFFWEFWAMPSDNAGATYMVSDGYGGAHALLFGFTTPGAREPGRYLLVGNIWNGNSLTYFVSDEGPAPHEWGHFAAGWDGTNIVIYFNGVPVGKTAWVGPRITPGGGGGCGRLLIGGSDHANFNGRIAQVRGYEDNNPREAGSAVFAAFAPQTVFSVDGNLLSYYFRPSDAIADLSLSGYLGRQHPGLVRSTVNGVLYPCDGCPLPQFVMDPTAPDFSHPNNPGQPSAPVDSPGAVPGGALAFDSFSRRNSTYAFGGQGGLGSTEGGSWGTRTWQTNADTSHPQPFGILNGRGVLLANTNALAWINTGSGTANYDIRVDRHAGPSGAGHNTGISFRVADASNYFFAYTSGQDPTESQILKVGYYQAGQRTDLQGVTVPGNWTTLRVVTTAAGSVGVYADNTLLYSTTIALMSNANGAGLYNNGPGLGLTNRWDNFTVLAAQP